MAKNKQTSVPFDFETIVIGSGPAGSTAAEIIAHGGQKVAIVEAERFGGECLNYGCVPTKSMLTAAHLFQRVKSQKTISNSGLLKLRLSRLADYAQTAIVNTGASELSDELTKSGVVTLQGRAYFLDENTVDIAGQKYTAKNFVIASGGEVCIPKVPGLDGLDYLTYKNFLSKIKEKVPRSVTIIGGGVVGCEYAQILNACGVKVNLVEASNHLVSNLETEASEVLEKYFESVGIKVYLKSRVVSASPSPTGNLKEVGVVTEKDGQLSLKTESVMVATGKKMNDSDGFSNAGVSCAGGTININYFCQTEQKHIYAIGDAAGPYRLTSTALMQAKVAANHILGKTTGGFTHADYSAIPSCMFTMPEVATVGESTASLIEKGIKFNVSLVRLDEVTRSRLEDDLSGFVKIWSDPVSKLILGACIVGPAASEQISTIALAIKTGITAPDLASVSQVFPTWSEAISIAASEL